MFGALFDGILGEVGSELVKLALTFFVATKAHERALEAHHRKHAPAAPAMGPPARGRPAGKGRESIARSSKE